MWMKIDDQLHAHRKTRAVTRSAPAKRRDIAPMGLWVAAGSWSAQNSTDGWVPAEELDRWDDDWLELAGRLVRAGYWWPHERDGEPGYGFTDWHDYNDPADFASKSGTYGNHVRWHVNEGRAEPDCDHCPKEPDSDLNDPSIVPRSGGDSPPISPPESRSASGAIALPEPDPTRTRPDPVARAIALRSGGDEVTPQTLIAEWIEHCEQRPPGRVVGQVSRELKALLDEGIEPERVRAALAEWNRKGLHPSTLASVVHEITNRKPAQRRGDIDWEAAFARAAAKTEGAQP